MLPLETRVVTPITFNDEDMWGVGYPHSDAIVLMVDLGGIEVGRFLVVNGSSCGILSLATFNKMGINSSNLKPCVGGLVSFAGHEAPIIGIISLPFILGNWPKAATEMFEFLVIDMPSAYNGILGRTSQALFGAITSIKHQVMKLPTQAGIGEA